MLNYSQGTGIYKDWILAEEILDLRHQAKCESIMHLANGYLGIRSAFEESYPHQTRGMFVCGTYNRQAGEIVELPNAADSCEMVITIDNEIFSMCSGGINNYCRQLNLKNGELRRSLEWTSPKGKKFSLVFRRFVSWSNKNSFALRLEIFPHDNDATVKIKTGINARQTNSGVQHFREGMKRVFDNKFMYLSQVTSQSKIRFSHINYCIFDKNCSKSWFALERRYLYQTVELQAKAGQPLVFEKIACVFTGTEQEKENIFAQKIISSLKDTGSWSYLPMLEESSKILEAFWRRFDIKADAGSFPLQLALRYAQYSLIEMMPPDKNSSIAAKGLSGEGYRGHVFWDTEVFMLPYFIHTQPSMARQLLEYRLDRIGKARENAISRGYAGLMFPWESADTGEEETPQFASLDIATGQAMPVWAGEKEHHITADIAFAIWNYWKSTGDDEFMDQGGSLILIGCALFWRSRAVYISDKDRYEIHDIVGPDEYTEHVDNNAYTNYLVWYVCKYALSVWSQLGGPKRDKIADYFADDDIENQINEFFSKLYLPQPDGHGLLAQDDSFFTKEIVDITHYRGNNVKQAILKDFSRHQVNEMQVLKQADVVMLLALYPRLFSAEIQQKCWKYYEPKTIHDSSLSYAIYSLAACGFNDPDRAWEFFRQAMKIDIGQNPESSDTGIHAAAMSGIWFDVIEGFAGVRRRGESLSINPCLPRQIDHLEFDLVFRRENFHLNISRTNIAITCRQSGNTTIYVNGRPYNLVKQLVIDY